jgi:acyl-coenzyme A thioesterase PaaI-like protein
VAGQPHPKDHPEHDGCWSTGLTPSPNVLNAVDALHGSVIAAVLDVAAYLAVKPHTLNANGGSRLRL